MSPASCALLVAAMGPRPQVIHRYSCAAELLLSKADMFAAADTWPSVMGLMGWRAGTRQHASSGHYSGATEAMGVIVANSYNGLV
jgi:hypothetical protein